MRSAVTFAVAALAALATSAAAQSDGVDFFGCGGTNTLAMTFDDGPDPNITPGLLDTLKSLGIKTTFFILGASAVNNRALVKRAYDEGHQIAHHTYDHLSLPSLTDAQVKDQIQRNEDLINSIIGHRTAIVRPPFGDSDARVYGIVKGMGYSIVKWNLDSNDWQGVDPFKIFDTDLKPGKGYMALQHDINFQETPAKIRQIYNLVKQRGFRFVSISECIGKQPYKDGWGNVVNKNFDGPTGGDQSPATSQSVAVTSATTTTSVAPTSATTTTTVSAFAQIQTTAYTVISVTPTATATAAAAPGAVAWPVVSVFSFFAAIFGVLAL
ncbi:hypothetical protein BJ742DRAFT_801400 [Cladochytrium replicatum]|nr:hypothetical protein BJ742DRAFT_801400 [Cladochytrium replicatum]